MRDDRAAAMTCPTDPADWLRSPDHGSSWVLLRRIHGSTCVLKSSQTYIVYAVLRGSSPSYSSRLRITHHAGDPGLGNLEPEILVRHKVQPLQKRGVGIVDCWPQPQCLILSRLLPPFITSPPHHTHPAVVVIGSTERILIPFEKDIGHRLRHRLLA